MNKMGLSKTLKLIVVLAPMLLSKIFILVLLFVKLQFYNTHVFLTLLSDCLALVSFFWKQCLPKCTSIRYQIYHKVHGLHIMNSDNAYWNKEICDQLTVNPFLKKTNGCVKLLSGHGQWTVTSCYGSRCSAVACQLERSGGSNSSERVYGI